MGERKERVVVEFTADGTNLESGISGLERKAQRLAGEQKKVNAEIAKMGGEVKKTSAHGNNFAYGFRDIMESRVANGLFRITSGLRLSGTAAAGAVGAFTVVSEAIHKVGEEAKADREEHEKLD